MMSTRRKDALAGRVQSRRRVVVGRAIIAATAGAMVLSGMVVMSGPAHAAASNQIKGAQSGRCVDVPGGASVGAQLELWDCNGNANQAVDQTGGSFRIQGRCLDAEGEGTANGTRVLWWNCNGHSNQKWSFSGRTVRNQNSGKCLDATGQGTANGTLLVLWTCNGQNNQNWSVGGSLGGGVGGGNGGGTGGGGTGGGTGGGGSTGGGSPTFSIPNNLGSHDPSRIINDGGKYFFWSTGGGGWYTTDGRNWRGAPSILPNGIPSEIRAIVSPNNGVWAPDVIWNPNSRLFNMYYAVANWDDQSHSAIGLLTSPTLNPQASNYRWTDRGVVIAGTPSNRLYLIDPAPFFDARGNMWLAVGSSKGKNVSTRTALNVIALNKNTGLRSDTAVHTVQQCVCEASYVQYHAGYYYLFWNIGSCCNGSNSTYSIQVTRSTSPTGPFTGTRTFKASSRGIHGPGQIGVISQNGRDIYSYHYYNDAGRAVLGIGTLTWSGGWPVS